MDSPDWILIDGFMTQSRVWLLELFRWVLYQQEIILALLVEFRVALSISKTTYAESTKLRTDFPHYSVQTERKIYCDF